MHRGRAIPTLASLQEPVAAVRYRQSKERSNLDLKDDRGNFILIFDLISDYFNFNFGLNEVTWPLRIHHQPLPVVDYFASFFLFLNFIFIIFSIFFFFGFYFDR